MGEGGKVGGKGRKYFINYSQEFRVQKKKSQTDRKYNFICIDKR